MYRPQVRPRRGLKKAAAKRLEMHPRFLVWRGGVLCFLADGKPVPGVPVVKKQKCVPSVSAPVLPQQRYVNAHSAQRSHSRTFN